MGKKLRIATVFSGIGAFEQALEKKKIPYEIAFACDNGEREINVSEKEIYNHINKSIETKKISKKQMNKITNDYVKNIYDETNKINYMKKSYFANYSNYGISDDNWYEDIRFIDGNVYKNKVDILVGGSPCQSFSSIGKRKGLEDARGTLFYYYAKLIQDVQPKVFIYENVPGMLTHDKGKTWNTIKEVFDSLGYSCIYNDETNNKKPIILNSVDYGIPQNRKRLFVIGFKNKKYSEKFVIPKKIDLKKQKKKVMFDYLEDAKKFELDSKVIPSNHYLGKKGFEFVTNPCNINRARVNQNIIQTQKANQQFNWNGDFVFVPKKELNLKKNKKDILNRAYVGKYNGVEGVARQLTPRECLNLMGFSEKFKIEVPNMHMYRQAGNSIVVNVLENLVTSIMNTGVFK